MKKILFNQLLVQSYRLSVRLSKATMWLCTKSENPVCSNGYVLYRSLPYAMSWQHFMLMHTLKLE